LATWTEFALTGALVLGLAGTAKAESWSVLGFTRDGRHALWQQELRSHDERCDEARILVLRVRDAKEIVRVPIRRAPLKPDGCGDARLVPAGRSQAIRARVEETYGGLAQPQPLEAREGRGDARSGFGLQVVLHAEQKPPETTCARITPELRSRAYLRFVVTRKGGSTPRIVGRLIMLPPVPDPAQAGCLTWPELRMEQAVLGPARRHLALVVSGAPLIVPLP
jgi:hypothetical protein